MYSNDRASATASDGARASAVQEPIQVKDKLSQIKIMT